MQWQRQAAAVKASSAPIVKTLAQTQAALTAVQTGLTAGTPATALDSLVPEVLLDVFNQRTAHGINLTVAAPVQQGGGLMTPMSALSEPVKGTSLQSVPIKLSGSYRTYPELLAYLAALQARPVAISYLKVQDNTFEVTIRVFGTNS